MAPRRKCVFNADLQQKYPFLLVGATNSDIICDICKSKFNIGAGGKGDIERHLETDKHKKALNARSKTTTVSNFFPSTVNYTTAACEGVWAYHVVNSNHSFKSSDCASKIFRTCFEMKLFHCARTKCQAIVTNVFAPFVRDEIRKDLAKVNYLTLSTDASNHGNVKMFPVLARYFVPTRGIRVKILELSSEPGETSEIIANLIKKTANEFAIEDKVAAFCGDNATTNFGSVERGGQNNVFYRLKQWIPSLLGIGCAAHIAHNALKSACDGLPVDIECVVVKIFSHFYIYTVRVESLKRMCEAMDGIEYKQLLGYASTRFLAMGPACGRILELFDALKAYFQSLPKGEAFIKAFFDNPFSKLWLIFVKDQVSSNLTVYLVNNSFSIESFTRRRITSEKPC